MLSLIICSREPDIPKILKDNISESIGVEYELVVIDNSKNNYSIFSAYNEGVKRSKYPNLCFMHDDILYHTEDWGKKVIEYLGNETVGIIGIGGSHFFSKYPVISFWNYFEERDQFYSFNLLQGYWNKKVYKTKLDYHVCSEEPIYGAFLDGVWFCMKKSLFHNSKKTIRFDDKTYNGFHLYDMDICMQVNSLNLHIQIITNVLIEHFSKGSFKDEWIHNSFLFTNKWKEELPLSRGIDLKKEDLDVIEYRKTIAYIRKSVEIQRGLQDELDSIKVSKAYLLGRFLLKPFRWIKL